MCDSPAKRKPEEEPEKVKSDDSVDEEKDQVGLAFKFLNSALFWCVFCNCEFTLGLSVDQK